MSDGRCGYVSGGADFGHFREFSLLGTLAGNTNLGARKSLQNAQKYLWKHESGQKRDLFWPRGLLGGWRHGDSALL